MPAFPPLAGWRSPAIPSAAVHTLCLRLCICCETPLCWQRLFPRIHRKYWASLPADYKALFCSNAAWKDVHIACTMQAISAYLIERHHT